MAEQLKTMLRNALIQDSENFL